MEPTRSTDLGALGVEEVMTSAVVTLTPDENIGRARALMLGLGIHGLPVVDNLGQVLGFVTSSDLVEEWPFGEPVETIMSRHVHSVELGTSVVDAAAEMVANKIHHLLVTNDGRPVGVVTSFDLMKALGDSAPPESD